MVIQNNLLSKYTPTKKIKIHANKTNISNQNKQKEGSAHKGRTLSYSVYSFYHFSNAFGVTVWTPAASSSSTVQSMPVGAACMCAMFSRLLQSPYSRLGHRLASSFHSGQFLLHCSIMASMSFASLPANTLHTCPASPH